MNSHIIKVKWAQNKLKAEVDSHKVSVAVLWGSGEGESKSAASEAGSCRVVCISIRKTSGVA